jgi:hypothetical protein
LLIKNTLRSLLTPVRMAIIKPQTGRNIEEKKGILIYCWWECELVQPLWTATWRLLKTLRTAL